jgi:hypothetical protein
MNWIDKAERRLLVWGPGWWTTTASLAVLLFWAQTAGPDFWAPASLITWLISTGLSGAAATLVAAEVWRRRAAGETLGIVQSQSFSGFAIVAIGGTVGAVAAGIRQEPPVVDLSTARTVWVIGSAVVVAAGAQLVLSTRRLISEGQAATTRVVAFERDAHLAELSAMQQRLEPALMLKTLDAIATRADTSPEDAERAVEALATYLRSSLQAPAALEAPLEEEIRRATEFMGILTFAGVEVPLIWRVDSEVLPVTIPTGTVHTFLHYAVERCLRDQQGQPTITVRAYRHADRFYLVVTDTAAPDPPALQEPQALSALRRRLGAPPQRRVRVIAHVVVEVDGTPSGTTQTLMKHLGETS